MISNSFFNKSFAVTLFALLMIGLGFAGFYIWQNQIVDDQEIKITAVPFAIIGVDEDQQSAIQEGLLDSMVFNINKIEGLKVTPTSDIQPFLGENNDAINIGKEFSSKWVLGGSYRSEAKGLVRVKSNLLNVQTGETLFSESFDVKAESQVELEKSIAMRISRKLYDKIATIEDERFIKTQKISKESSRLYLTGQQILRNNEYDRRDEGINSFKKILEHDPNWAKGFAKYAEALILIHGGIPDWDKVKVIAEKGLQLDDNLPEAHLAMGWYYQSRFELDKAEKSFERAIEINPKYAQAYLEYGMLLDTRRKFAKAEVLLQKANELKPFDPFFYATLCKHYYYDKQWNNAINICKEALLIDPNFDLVQKHIFWIYAEKGEYYKLLEGYFGEFSEKEIEEDHLLKPLKDGNMKLYWQRRIEDRLKNNNRRYSPLAIAGFYAQLQDIEKTLQFTEETAEKSPIDLIFLNPDPAYDFVRNEPRFKKIMKKFNLDS